MDGHNYHYSREFYDRYAQGQEKSVVNKMQQKYWKTKQTLIKVTGKKEDEHVVASDSDLDAKLELFHSIQRTCMELLKVIEQYQKRICFLSQEENELGKFLRSQGSQNKSRAGKIMQATGKALCFSSQQRLALRSPLSRLHQEVETFRYRAISDCWLTVNRMEQARTEYRGVLLWMKDVSQELDPDLYKQMEKFRKVQAQVRHTKAAFDRLKTDVCEKVDLLRASRCNLLSHVLTNYQTTLLHFWEKTSHTMAAIHESFKGYQPYEFTTLKSLQDPLDKLCRQSKKKTKAKEAPPETQDNDQLISLDEQQNETESMSSGTLDDLLDLKPEEKFIFEESATSKDPLADPFEPDSLEKDEMQLLNEILSASSLDSGELGKEWTAIFGEPLFNAQPLSPASPEPEQKAEQSSGFLPSQLLDQEFGGFQATPHDWSANFEASSSFSPSSSSSCLPPTNLNQNFNRTPVKDASKSTKDLSSWYNLFADLDPLSNPDAVGKTDKEHELLNA
ncbi:islet cell autoantigen 1 [Bufo gargarizans]|uniref:islet cell autoantigen 1 n=1 Tax=Bufo gargarizans TaxID=30331 RepID=UPI001CF3D188|nr:islet cell autoantigen 1 [Bufo gargarizans]XP_044149834.1 islet cell autoantigen 1 [Bufo gargarizans]XP_044149835.1 islet cell autoantigen 1 [Bufo gargarizans]XP_044149836.1 islet cell autoantigen 1 [Bufo gargarizans]